MRIASGFILLYNNVMKNNNITAAAKIKELMQNTGGLQIVAAIYDTESGKVEFDI